MLSLDEALQRLLQVATRHVISESESVDTFDALGRVLAQEVRSALDVPPADNTSMDGYALRAADLGAPARCCRCRSAFPQAQSAAR